MPRERRPGLRPLASRPTAATPGPSSPTSPACRRASLGKIGVAVSPAQPGRVWALVEAEDGGVFRSDDGGETWEQRQRRPQPAPARLVLHPHLRRPEGRRHGLGAERRDVAARSTAARPSRTIPRPHGDNHDLWIDPDDPQRMIEGNDGGASVSFNGGGSWSTIYNQPTAQFYHVTTDNRTPYRVYGAQQDNTTMRIPSRANGGAITARDWYDDRRRRERLHRRPTRQPGHRLRRLATAASSPATTTHAASSATSPSGRRTPMGCGAEELQVPLPVDLPDPLLAARPEHALRRRQPRLPLDRRGRRAGSRSAPT